MKKVLIHLHVFYEDQVDMFLSRINQTKHVIDPFLFVTISEIAKHKEQIENKVRILFPKATIQIVSNIGYDIAPFIHVLHNVNLEDYDYVMKLHTKGRGTEPSAILNGTLVNDKIWDDMLIDTLLNPDNLSKAISFFEDDNIGLISASRCIVKENPERIEYYCMRINDELEKMDLKAIDSYEFVAGTMFLVRSSLVKLLLHYRTDDFGYCYPGIHDYTLAHVFERLFSAVVLSQGYQLQGIESKHVDIKLKLMSVVITGKRIENFIKKMAQSKTIRPLINKLNYKFNQKAVIRNSDYFDDKWYQSSNPDCMKTSPVNHYLTTGYKDNRDPSQEFKSSIYYQVYPEVLASGINPLLHYECYGKYEERSVVFHNLSSHIEKRQEYYVDSDERYKNQNYPKGSGLTTPINKTGNLHPANTGRNAIIAMYTADGSITDSFVKMLSALSKITDNIIVVGDCYTNSAEISKIDKYVTDYSFEPHGLKDFGSYKKGYEIARSTGLLDQTKELIMMNDYCTYTGQGFDESFQRMKEEKWDVWGYYGEFTGLFNFIYANFCVFNEKIIRSKLLDEFFCRVRNDEYAKDNTTRHFESELSYVLQSQKMDIFIYYPFNQVKDNDLAANLRDSKLPIIKPCLFEAESRGEEE